ncbi:MAG: DUF1254 domain-containing protein [Ruminococcus sp.]|nr:DUF1254 domain-containing protein [Ruminococcus sp.]
MSALTEKAKKLYIYAFPEIITEITHWGSDDKSFAHMREFPDHTNKKVVKMNNDTLYSLAWTQLVNSPYIIHIPEITERYYLFPILDAYTNVFESISKRTPDHSTGDYILLYQDQPVPEGYENYTVLRSNHSLNGILLRVESRGRKDYAVANAIQDKITIEPLYPEKIQPVRSGEGIVPVKYIENISAREFYQLFAELSKVNPIEDEEYAKIFSELGYNTETGDLDYDSLSDEQRSALEESLVLGLKEIRNESRGEEYLYRTNGWSIITGGVGVYGNDYLRRASTAYSGWGANIVEDSAYGIAFTDIDGQLLSNKNDYKLHIEADGYPHAAIFWSITLYGEPSHFPVPNKIGRIAINTYDVDDNIVQRNEDGSLDIYVSKNEPADEKARRNWLPAPQDEENYTLTLRAYWPDEETLTGKWTAPVITRL